LGSGSRTAGGEKSGWANEIRTPNHSRAILEAEGGEQCWGGEHMLRRWGGRICWAVGWRMKNREVVVEVRTRRRPMLGAGGSTFDGGVCGESSEGGGPFNLLVGQGLTKMASDQVGGKKKSRGEEWESEKGGGESGVEKKKRPGGKKIRSWEVQHCGKPHHENHGKRRGGKSSLRGEGNK